MAFTLRPYQPAPIQAAIEYLRAGKSGGLLILPTAAGKSICIANIILGLNERVLVMQPSKEILKQNFLKYRSYGFYASVFSASLKKKEISKTVFATIGSIVERPTLFQNFKYVIIDEAHYVNSKRKIDSDGKEQPAGMYDKFLQAMPQAQLIGCTATPFRLSSDGFGSILKFLTRTRPRIFKDVIYVVQIGDLYRNGWLSKLVYYKVGTFNRDQIKRNSTGADFDERSLRQYYDKINFGNTILIAVKRLMEIRKSILVFVRFVREAEGLAKLIPGAEYISGEMSAEKRDDILNRFQSGKLKCLLNVGILVVGFDKPDLDTIVVARETMSLAWYYQAVGRGLRIHPDKENCWIVDMCGNLDTFGKVEDLIVEEPEPGKWVVTSNGKQLTNQYFGDPFKPRKQLQTPLGI